jgi:hypothetical protein
MPKPLPPIEALTDESLPDFCAFLNANLSSDKTPEQWLAGFRVPWESRRPNYGFVIRDSNGAIVGGLGAIYSRQTIAGKSYDFCNLTSWCVTEPYRSQSMRLAMALASQPDFEITNFSPTKVVAGVLRFLNFRELDERITFFPNLPAAVPSFTGTRVITDRDALRAALRGALPKVYGDHAAYPWLKFLLLEAEGRQCLVVFKQTRVKSLRGAKILYTSDRALYAMHLRKVSSALLLRFGLFFTQIESRFLARKVAWSKEVGGYNRKLFLSKNLTADDIDYIYSESTCFDL